MSSPDRPYVRVYHDDLRRDYPTVYANDAALSTWLRLLVIADKMWPTPAELPRSVRSRPLALLVDVGLVVIQGTCFVVRGYNAERLERQEKARSAVAVRWQNARNTDVLPSPSPSPSPNPNVPPNPPRGARQMTNRRATPLSFGEIVRKASESGR